MSELLDINIWISLLTLTVLEIILGVDNLVFISIVSSRIKPAHQKLARRLGLIGALVMRLILLASVFWLIGLVKPVFFLFDKGYSIRDLVLIFGGLFLLYKATIEIHNEIQPIEMQKQNIKTKRISLFNGITQIMIFDIIFSLDTILTAVGLTDYFWVMAVAIIITILCMLLASEPLHHFIETFPTVKMLALSFLLLIGVALIADAYQLHIPREYIYFAIAFSIFVEFMNQLAAKRRAKK